jgi:hypothetical protein
MDATLKNDLLKFWSQTYTDAKNPAAIWTRPLSDFYTGQHIPLEATYRTLLELERPLLLEVYRRIPLIPPRGHRAAGRAFVELALQLAHTALLPDQVASRILGSCYELQGLRAPITDATSFRVSKHRMQPAV